jgi:hypothetical protein
MECYKDEINEGLQQLDPAEVEQDNEHVRALLAQKKKDKE